MSENRFDFAFVEKYVRKKTFGFLSVIDARKNVPHTTGILYGVSNKEDPFVLYVLTKKSYKKVKLVRNNPNISFAIPFPHYILRFIPANTVMFQGKCKILASTDEAALKVFEKKRVLRMNIKELNKGETTKTAEYVFLKIHPYQKVFCYGLGISLLEMMRNIEAAAYSVNIPQNRLEKSSDN